jgi:hypothetical protein
MLDVPLWDTNRTVALTEHLLPVSDPYGPATHRLDKGDTGRLRIIYLTIQIYLQGLYFSAYPDRITP